MRLKVDENVHPAVASLLVSRGHDVSSVWDEGLGGHSDPELATACQREGRALLTLDLDFADIVAYPPHEYPGIIVVRLHLQSRDALLRVMARAVEVVEADDLRGKLYVLDESRIRVRSAGYGA